MKNYSQVIEDHNKLIYYYNMILNLSKKYLFNFNCNENQKNCGHDSELMKTNSMHLEKVQGLLVIKKANSSNIEDLNEVLNYPKINKKKSEISLDRLEKSTKHKIHPTIESFNSENNEIVSEYSKSFQDNPEGDEIGIQVTNDSIKKLKKSDSGVQHTFSNNEMENYFNSLKEKNLI